MSMRTHLSTSLTILVIGVLALVAAAPAAAKPPTISVFTPTFTAATTAQTTASLIPNGQETSCAVEYGQTTAYGNSTDCEKKFTSSGLAQVQLESLQPSTLYHARMIATNADGTTKSADTTFTTKAPGAPIVSTSTGKAEDANNALVRGSVLPNGAESECLVEYGRTSQYDSFVFCDQVGLGVTGRTPITAKLSGLVGGTEYHYRVVAFNEIGRTFGPDGTFVMLRTPTVPGVVTASVGATTLQITAPITANGLETTCFLEYGLLEFEHTIPCSRTFTSSLLAQFFVESLRPVTPYRMRLVAENEDGTTVREQFVFTGPAGAPLVAAKGATAIGQTSAVANGVVTPNGATVTSCVVQFGLTTQYGSTVPCDQTTFGDTGKIPVTATLSGLSPNTEYHYRVVSQNEIGTKNGADTAFRTLP
jgi:hypothetical protein